MLSHEIISKERELFLESQRKYKNSITRSRILLFLLLILFWELLTAFNIIDGFIISSPSRIVKTIYKLVLDGELFKHLLVTCFEVISGFLISTVAGTLIAMLFWWNKKSYEIFEPAISVINSLPKTALGPIFIVWAGSGMKSIVLVTISVSVTVTILEIYTGFIQTNNNNIKLLKSLNATKFQIFTNVVFPSNYKTVLNSLKVNVGLSWVGAIVGEFLVSKAGIGYLIVYGSAVFKMDLVMSGIIILAVVSFFMYKAINHLGNKFIV